MTTHDLVEQIVKQNPQIERVDAKKPWRIYPIDELVSIDFPPQRYIIDKLLTSNGIGIISGKPGMMKSFITLHMAMCVAQGLPVFDEFTTEKGNVLIVDLENTPARIKDRILSLYQGKEVNNSVVYLFSEDCSDFDITKEEHVNMLIDIIKAREIKFVVLDSFIKIFKNKKEDSSVEMALIFSQIRKLRNIGCSILIIHHHVKGIGSDDLDMMRGSGNIGAELDNQFSVQIEKDNKNMLTITPGKNRYDELYRSFNIKYVKEGEYCSFQFVGISEKQDGESRVNGCADFIIEVLSDYPKGLLREEIMRYAESEGFARDVREAAIKFLLSSKKIIKTIQADRQALFRISDISPSLNPDVYNTQGFRDLEYSMDEIIEKAEKGELMKVVLQ